MRGRIPAKTMSSATAALTKLPKATPKPAKIRKMPV